MGPYDSVRKSYESVQKSYNSIQDCSNSNLHCRNTLFWLKIDFKRWYYRNRGLGLPWDHIEACQFALLITTNSLLFHKIKLYFYCCSDFDR